MNQWTAPNIVGFYEPSTEQEYRSAAALFDSLGLPNNRTIPTGGWVLIHRQNPDQAPEPGTPPLPSLLELQRPDGVKLCLDFSSGKALHRAKESGKGIQPLARALGFPAYRKQFGQLPTLIDATGGLGQDAWALATLGASITVIERHPIVHALLANALQRALAHAQTRETAQRFTLLHGAAETHLPSLSAHAIYLDPMYPERSRKRAGSRKGMQFLHALLGPPPDEQAGNSLLTTALRCTVSRVVVKRPRGAELLAGTEHWLGQRTCLESPNTRYDIYHCH